MLRQAILLTASAVAVVSVVVLGMQPDYSGVRAGEEDEGYLRSGSCRSCHPDHHASWRRTHHSRMTQDASPRTVLGDFERDNRFRYLGVDARLERRGDRYLMELSHPDGTRQEIAIERTIGSRRMQQYVARSGDRYVRLPLAYDLENRRWMSLNGSFFHPDGDDYFQHDAVWDLNCVFCHNVKAQPRLDRRANRVATEVAELAIACGACHGRSAEHAQEALAPWTRALWRLGLAGDRQVVQPAKLPPDRSLMVCGHCHGQRVPEPLSRIEEILGRGDPYDAGEDLATTYRPIARETTIGSHAFATRFWEDGSPRLTAYEYQGILRSACFQKGRGSSRITCLTCHSMHEGDPKGMIREERRGDGPCLGCHRKYEPPAELARHTGHAADSAGSRCYACHMPRVVYGVMSIHPTHEISVPDPRTTMTKGVPNACNQCHVDRSLRWSLEWSRRLWPQRYVSDPPVCSPSFDLPEGVRALFGGDAVERALAAEALGGGGGARTDPSWARAFLVEAFTDRYPIIRYFAANALADMRTGLPKPDYLADAGDREAQLEPWRRLVSAEDQGRAVEVRRIAVSLRLSRKEVDIEVGE